MPTRLNPNKRDETILTVREAAEILKVSILTIKNYIYQGKLKSFKTPGGHHRILKSDLEALMKKTELPLDYFSFLEPLITALEIRDTFTKGHSARVADYSLLIARDLKLSEEALKNIRLASLLHDLGKICINESILKKPEKLTEKELLILKFHPEMGERIIEPVEAFRPVKPFIRHHHERYDGNGYPDRLAKEDIPQEARIISVAESYDSMTSDSSYRKKLSKEEAIAELKSQKDKQFDPQTVEVFLEAIKLGQ